MKGIQLSPLVFWNGCKITFFFESQVKRSEESLFLCYFLRPTHSWVPYVKHERHNKALQLTRLFVYGKACKAYDQFDWDPINFLTAQINRYLTQWHVPVYLNCNSRVNGHKLSILFAIIKQSKGKENYLGMMAWQLPQLCCYLDLLNWSFFWGKKIVTKRCITKFWLFYCFKSLVKISTWKEM